MANLIVCKSLCTVSYLGASKFSFPEFILEDILAKFATLYYDAPVSTVGSNHVSLR